MTNSPNFKPIKVELLKSGVSEVKSLVPETLWSNPIFNIDSSEQMINFNSTYNGNLLIIKSTNIASVILNGVSNTSIITEGSNFNTSNNLYPTIEISSSSNVYLEANLQNSSSTTPQYPLYVDSSSGIYINNSALHSSSKEVHIVNSNAIQFSNTKFANFSAIAASFNNVNNVLVSDSNFSNSTVALQVNNSFDTSVVLSQSSFNSMDSWDTPVSVNNTSYINKIVMSHLTFKENNTPSGQSSIYLNASSYNLTANQILSTGNNPNSEVFFISYADPGSVLNFSQLAFSNHIQNIKLKYKTSEVVSPPMYNFDHLYIDGESNDTCEFLNSNSQNTGYCTNYLEKKNLESFGSFYETGTSMLYDSLTFNDWITPSNNYYWGKYGAIGYCSSSEVCAQYTNIPQGNSPLLDSSKAYTGYESNGVYVGGNFTNPGQCTEALSLESEYIKLEGTQGFYLVNASEVNTDIIGNNNGLCEQDETCIYSPNIGSYQGHHRTNNSEFETCDFSPTLNITNVKILAYEQNGHTIP